MSHPTSASTLRAVVLVGWRVLGEPGSSARLGGFAFIWFALTFVASDQLSSQRPIDRSDPSFGERIVRP